MKRLAIIVAMVMMTVTAVGGYGYAQSDSVKKAPVNAGNIVCPVMGTKVEPGKALTVEYNGKLYNVCCPICIGEFKKNPAKYAAKAEKNA